MLGLGIAGIVLATLYPAAAGEEGWSTCMICGSRGVADAVLNFLLFVPLGVGIRLVTSRSAPSAGGALLLSLVVELAQQAIPGRDPSLRDLVFNTLGGLAGGLIVPVVAAAMSVSRRRAGYLALLVGFGVAAVVVATGILARPALPGSTYFGQWTPRLGHLDLYRGRVLQVSVGNAPIGRRRIDEAAIRGAFMSGEALEIVAIAGPPPERIAPIFSVFDRERREILLIGAHGPHLVLHLRTRSRDLLLDQPDLRSWNLLRASAAGDTLRIRVQRRDGGLCASVNGAGECGIALSVGSGWSLFYALQSSPRWAREWLGRGWAFALLLPLGLVLRRERLGSAALVVAGVALLALPGWVGLQPTPPGELVAAASGCVAGVLLRRKAVYAAASFGGPGVINADTRPATHRSMRR